MRWLLLTVLVGLVGCHTDAPARSGAVYRRLEALRARPGSLSLRSEEPATWLVSEGRLTNGTSPRLRASVPQSSGGAATFTDLASGLTVHARLEGLTAVSAARFDEVVVFPRALGGADVLEVAGQRGVEDLIAFEERPPSAHVTYELTLAPEVKGLRLIDSTLELLDGEGTPRLRLGGARIVDAAGAWHEVKLDLEGCAADGDPRGPWGRPVVDPGARSCRVTLSWTESGAFYPAVLDPTWTTTLGTMATPRSNFASFLLPTTGKVLVAGGFTTGLVLTASAELYDEVTGTFAGTGPMLRQRSDFAAAYTSGFVAVTGGTTGGSKRVEFYTVATGTWNQGLDATAHDRAYGTGTRLADGRVLFAGGQGDGGGCTARWASADVWTPSTNVVVPVTGTMTVGRGLHATSLLADGRVLLAGGLTTCCPTLCGGATATSELYDPVQNTFSPGPAMSSARVTFPMQPLGATKVLVAGGLDGPFTTAISSSELYTVVSGGAGSFGQGALIRMGTGGGGLSALATLSSGRVMFAGGWLPSAPTASTATTTTYDEPTNTWTPDAPLTVARRGHGVVVTALGRTLVCGGVDGQASSLTVLSSCETYDLQPLGGACSGPGVCGSGVCEDGVCCGMACPGPCARCDLGSTGACALVLQSGAASPSCPNNFVCDGVSAQCPTTCTTDVVCQSGFTCILGACRVKVGPGGSCTASAQCLSGPCVDSVCCDTTCAGACDACNLANHVGVCTPQPPGFAGQPGCAPYRCDGATAACPSSCTLDSQCVVGDRCIFSHCEPPRINGALCASSADCASTFCADGVCCNARCDEACDRCNLVGSEGRCLPAPVGAMGVPACTPYVCDGTTSACPTTCTSSTSCTTGQCTATHCTPGKDRGQACAKDFDCTSLFCVDGVCCDKACDGACDACNLASAVGTCTVTTRGSAGSPPCTPFSCDGANAACPTGCTSDPQCATGSTCSSGVCVSRTRGHVGFGCTVVESWSALALGAVLRLLRRRRPA